MNVNYVLNVVGQASADVTDLSVVFDYLEKIDSLSNN